MQDHFDILQRDRNRLEWYFNSAVKNNNMIVNDSKGSARRFLEKKQAEMQRAQFDKLKKSMRAEKPAANPRLSFAALEGKELSKKEADVDAFDEPTEDEALADDPFGDDLAPDAGGGDLVGGIQDLRDMRNNAKQYYRQLGAVKEWVENNYYKLPIEQHLASRVNINAFWRDFAAHTDGPFISSNVAEATSNFTEMMFALSVLDLPFESGKIDSNFNDGKMVLKPKNDLILYHREIEETAAVDNNAILINQKYFDINNRYAMEGREKVEKYITEEFEKGKVYGARIIVNNPSARARKLEVLTQLPQGAIPVKGSMETMTNLITLNAYTTTTLEYFFYFPMAGKFKQFPVHISQEGKLIGYVAPFNFNVVDELLRSIKLHGCIYLRMVLKMKSLSI